MSYAATMRDKKEIAELKAENAKLKEQNIQYEFALKLLIDELNELKD